MAALLGPIEPYLWAALAVLLIAGGVYECHRLEAIGAANTKLADAAARADEQQKAAVLTAHLQALADQAQVDRNAAQNDLATYMAQHPVGVVRVCNGSANSRGGLPQAGASDSGTPNTSPGSPAVGQVLGGSTDTGTDIGPELDTILRSAGAVSGNFAELQKRAVGK